MARPDQRRDLALAAISAAVGIWAFIQLQTESKEMTDPIMAACGGDSSADVELVPYEPRLGGFLVCIGTQFVHKLVMSPPAGFIAWAATISAFLPLGLLINIESGRSGARGPVLYPTLIGFIGVAIGISVSFPLIWVPGFLLGGSRDGAVPSVRPYAAAYLMPPIIVLTYLLFNLNVATYQWTFTAGLILSPLFPMMALLLWRLKPKPVEAVTPQDVSLGAKASASCYLLASIFAFGMWVTVLMGIFTEYGLSLEAFWDGVWTNANGMVRFMVIDAVGVFAGGLCYVASVDPVDAVAATLISPFIGPGTSIGLILWGHEKLRDGKARAELITAEIKNK